MRDRTGEMRGNYRLIRLLGRGGFAEVYLAEHIYLKTLAAVKLLHGSLSSEDIDDFLREARTIAGLKHPHIVRISDFGIENREPYIIMDFAPNKTLRDLYPRGAIVPLAEILTYAGQVGEALTYTHQHKLIHRDVKPENMLLDEHNQILLSDFGIAAIAHSAASMETQTAIGTVQYMAPEQIQGYPTPASDQYSLGIVVYEWLCGTRPFSGSNFVEIGMKQATQPVPSLRKKIPTISYEIEQVVFRALEKDQQQRFPSIQDFVLALDQAIGKEKGKQAEKVPEIQPVKPLQSFKMKDEQERAENIPEFQLDAPRQPLKARGEQAARFQAARVLPPTQPAKIEQPELQGEASQYEAPVLKQQLAGQIHEFAEQKGKPVYDTPLIRDRLSLINFLHFVIASAFFSFLVHNWLFLVAGLVLGGILAAITANSIQDNTSAGDQKMLNLPAFLVFPVAWSVVIAWPLSSAIPFFLALIPAVIIGVCIGLFGHVFTVAMALPSDFSRKK